MWLTGREEQYDEAHLTRLEFSTESELSFLLSFPLPTTLPFPKMSFPPSVTASVAETSVPVPLATASDAVPTHILPPQPKGEIVKTDDRFVHLLFPSLSSIILM